MERTIRLPTPRVQPFTAVVPVNKGGTGARNVLDAATNLGGINTAQLNAANGVAQADGTGALPSSALPAAAVYGPTLNGPTQLTTNQTATFVITNYDSNTDYAMSATGGAVVSRVGDTITYVTPSTIGNYTLTINGKVFNMAIGTARPAAPTVTSSSSGNATYASIILNSSIFTMLSGSASHKSTDWELYSDASLANLIASSIDDVNNKTGYVFTKLALNTTYYARVRYKSDANLSSDWSTTLPVTTLVKYVPTAETAIVTAADRAANDMLGRHVAVTRDGTRMAVGAPGVLVSGVSNAGALYIFTRSGSTWTQEQKIVAPEVSTGDNFGLCVAFDRTGTRLVTSSPSGDYGATDSGIVYTYTRSGSVWTQEQRILAPTPSASAFFGNYVDMSSDGTRFVATMPAYNTSTGIIYIYLRTGSVWNLEATLSAPDAATNSYFGKAADFDGTATRLVVGAYLIGKVYIYVRSGTNWSLEQKIVGPTTTGNFGYDVCIDYAGLRIIVGCQIFSSGAAATSGSAYAYVRDATTNIWTQEFNFVPNDGVNGDLYGTRTLLNSDGSIAVVTAQNGKSASVTGCGAAYIYTRVDSTWTFVSKLTASNAAAGAKYGLSASIDDTGDILAIGARDATVGGLSNAGAVYVNN